MSATENFTETRKGIENVKHYVRGNISSVKRRPYVARKIPITPINLNDIQKELEADEEADNHEEVDNYAEETEEKFANRKVLFQNNDPHIAVVNANALSSYNNSKKEDSFDLNFSALSINTPIKSKALESNTPNVNVYKSNAIPPDKFEHQFATPKVNPPIFQSARRTTTVGNTPTSVVAHSGNKHTPSNPFITRPVRVQKIRQLPTFQEENVSCSNKENHKPKLLPSIVAVVENPFKNIKVNNNEYMVLGHLGKGGSSNVFQCYNPSNRIHVAIKCVSLDNPATATGYINEVKVLHKLQNCDKIITMFDYEILESEKKLLVVLEKGGEDLSTILKQLATKTSHIPMYMLLFYWMEMLYAVRQIHMHGIIHSDLKPANFLKADGGLKLIDFGIASCVDMDMTSVIKTAQEGSCNYISPEALNSDSSSNSNSPSYGKAKYKLNYKSDVWSLGCILYQLVYRKTPFQHITQVWPKLMAILNPNHVIDYPNADWVSPKIVNTIKRCLQYNVKSRPSVDELISEYNGMLQNL